MRTTEKRLQRRDPLPWRLRVKNDGDEAGVVLVLYTLAIVAVLLFAALAVDLGNIAQTKQHAQDAADAAALSAVWDLASIVNGGSVLADESQAVADVDNYLQHNYPSVQTPLGLTSCGPLPGPLPAGVIPSQQTDCVGFYPATSPNTIVVVIPAQNVNFTFGRVGGNTSQAVSATAEASLTSPGAGYELPYAFCISSVATPSNCASSSSGVYGLQCLKTGSGNQASACLAANLGPGNFGEVFSPRYVIYPSGGNPTGAGNDPVMMADIDLGIDHALVPNPNAALNTSADNTCDYYPTAPNCGSYNDTAPYNTANAVVTATGQTLDEAGPALFNADINNFTVDGCTFTVPRFNHPDGFQSSGTCSQDNPPGGFTPSCPCLSPADSFGSGLPLNGVHLTDFLIGASATPSNPTTSSLYQSCYAGQGPPGDPNPSPSHDAIDKTSGGQNVWSSGDPCLSTQIQSLATNAACLSTPIPASCQIFSTDIAESPRFGQVPVVTPVGGKKGDAIVSFDDVFIYQASGNGTKVDSITAWIFPYWMVKNGPVPGQPSQPPSLGPLTANLCSLAATPSQNCLPSS
jgi:hypothetical protein